MTVVQFWQPKSTKEVPFGVKTFKKERKMLKKADYEEELKKKEFL